MDILGIGYLGFESPNAKAWLEYGPEVMGFGLADPRDDDETVYLRMDDRRYRIAAHPGETDRISYIGWELRSRPSFESALDKLRTAGIEFEAGGDELRAKRCVRDLVRFKDPVGYQHELFYGHEYHPRSFVPGRPHGGFVAEEMGVGHVVLAIPEYPPELDTFLREVLGFTWFGRGAGKGNSGFYRSKLNPRTHCIAYTEVPGRFGIHHIGIEVRDLDDVGIACDLVQERGLPLQITLGRHTQDPVVSFYSFTPSGFVIEYLTGGAVSNNGFLETKATHLSVWGHKVVGPMLPSTVAPIEST